MKKLLLASITLLLAIATIVFAQAGGQATLRTPNGDKPLPVLHENGQTYFSVDDVLAALGGTLVPQGNGFNATLNNVSAAFGPDSRFAVVHEELIEMPVPPVTADGKEFATLAFFQGFLPRAANLDASWDAAGRVLQVRPQPSVVATAQLSVANIQGITKVVVTLSAAVDYTILKSQTTYIIRFKTPVRPAVAEETYEDPNVAKTTFAGNDLRIQFASPDVIGDAYKLENPFRVVIDLRKGTPQTPGTPPPAPLAPRTQEQPPGIHTIVIDPGHGGKDVGAMGPGGTMEKDTTLALCRRLASALEAKTGARVVLTRDDDTLIALDQRTALANQYKADLFLSVHMNAAVVKGARGSETYFLSADASDELARKAAETENAAARTTQDSSGDLKLILWDLAQQEYLQESSRFASDVQEEMNAVAGIQNRGVKQAPFKVLVGASMPAALVEVAFISNPEEESRLKDDKFVGTVIDALTRAVVRYKTDYETRIGVIRPPQPPAGAPAQPPTSTAASAARTGT